MLLKTLSAVTVAIFVLHLFASYYFWYQDYPWFDIPMHFLGGIWTALILIYILCVKYELFEPSSHLWVNVALITGLVVLTGSFWEFYEYISATVFPRLSVFFVGHSGSLPDTLGDLWNDILGGLIVSVFYFRKKI